MVLMGRRSDVRADESAGRNRLISILRIAWLLLFYSSCKNNNRPMGKDVLRTLRGISGDLSLFGDVLVLGDSTSVYFIDRQWELTWKELMEKMGDECGASFSLRGLDRRSPRVFCVF